jgi:glycosyltransferase involved in cell wall biosynthesis
LRSLAAELGISNRTFFVDDYMPREKLLFLTACSDAYISLHRGEGLGMGMLEAMSLGVPVIATDFGGNTDFVNGQTAYPVPYKLTAAKSDMPAYNFVSEWAQPDVEVAASFLRQIYSDREEAKRKISKAKNFIESNYSNENFRSDLLTFLAI